MNPRKRTGRRAESAVTLASTMVAMALLGIGTAAAVTVIINSFFTVRMAQENDRATQILIEKTESIRLYNWDQISSNGFIPATFSIAYDPAGGSNQGVTYSGVLDIAPPAIGSSYSNDLKAITVRVSWQTGGLQRQRELTTLLSRYGLEDYIY